MAGAVKTAVYPDADRSQRYWPNGGGILQPGLDKLVLHSTETPGDGACPRYSSGGTAPSMTVNPWPGHQKRWQHFKSVAMSAKALRDTGGFAENRDNVAQVEIIGYSDKKYGNAYGFYLPNLPQEGIDYIAETIAWFNIEWGIPVDLGGLTWKHYPLSYGTNNGVRLSTSQFDKFTGILGHMHAPNSVHGDPDLDIAKLIATTKAKLSSAPEKPQKPVVAPVKIPATIRKGSKGANVLKAQKALTAKGFKVELDSIFGGDTEAAAKRFQKAKKLTADGVIGPNTWRALLT